MQIAKLASIKKELSHLTQEELIALCLRLSKFKKENKELLNYLLFMESDPDSYIEEVKQQMDREFDSINNNNYYWIKKSVRKILRYTKKQIRFTLSKEVSVELSIYFCFKMSQIKPAISQNTTLLNLYNRQIAAIKKEITALHEDLQFDFLQEVESLEDR